MMETISVATKEPHLIIGIDPGKQTGIAVFHTATSELMIVETLDFWSAYEWAIKYYITGDLKQLVIEVPDTKHIWQKPASTPKALQRQGVNVGSVIREAQLLADGIERWGVDVKRVNPRKKVDAKTFKDYTGWTGRTNQHERDAAMLCYRKPRHA